MKENSELIHYACAESIVKLFKHSMPKDNSKEILKLFFDYPVKFIEGGINLYLQRASSLFLCLMIEYLKSQSENELLNIITPSIVSLFIKTSYESSFLYDSLLHLINSELSFNHFSDRLKDIYEKLIKIIENLKTADNSKVSCANIFKSIGQRLLKDKGQTIIGFYLSDVNYCLKNLTKDRIS